ncbi:hypothetical protein BH23ACT5_BH23ACT5_00020 [soil metagenome]
MTTTYTLNEVDIATVAALTQAVSADPSTALTTWNADVRWTGGFRSEATIGDHTPIHSDEPTGLGGTATAPNPVEQLLGALGNCLAVGWQQTPPPGTSRSKSCGSPSPGTSTSAHFWA